MFVSLTIVFREAMEAGLIVGIVLAASEGVAGLRAAWPRVLPVPVWSPLSQPPCPMPSMVQVRKSSPPPSFA
jgi:hypothetical protein